MTYSRTLRRRLAAAIRHDDPSALATAAHWRAALSRSSDVDYMPLLEAENARIEAENCALKDQVQPRLAALPELYVERLNAIDLERKLLAVEAVRPDIEHLPEDLPDVIRLIERFYPDRIVFCGAARSRHERPRSTTCPAVLGSPGACCVPWPWCSMISTLGVKRTSLEAFKINRGSNSLWEGASTRQDAELMRPRFVEHDGTVIDIFAHVKYGHRGPRLLRVHYGFCVHCLRIVVGHCGDHLPTAGTRRLK